jgi:hypothetical protein
MKRNFTAIILGGTGQVGGAAVAVLLAIPECREVVMVTRKPTAARSRVRNVVLDTGAADFAEHSAALAREVLSQGPASAVSCVGVGSGSARWSEEELQRLEVGKTGRFRRHGSHAQRHRRRRAVRHKSGSRLPTPAGAEGTNTLRKNWPKTRRLASSFTEGAFSLCFSPKREGGAYRCEINGGGRGIRTPVALSG